MDNAGDRRVDLAIIHVTSIYRQDSLRSRCYDGNSAGRRP